MGIISTAQREFRSLTYHFTNAAAPEIIPSPLEIVANIYADVRAHIAHVRREQEAFQQRLQAIGVERLCRMSTRDILENYGAP